MKKHVITITVLGILMGGIAVLGEMVRKQDQNHFQLFDDCNKFKEFYVVMNRWLKLSQNDVNLSEYFIRNNIKTIAIYGMKELGEALLNELKDSDVIVEYAIDRNAKNINAKIDILSPEDELGQVDAVIVTAIHYFDEIEIAMRDKVDCPILSLDDILFDM